MSVKVCVTLVGPEKVPAGSVPVQVAVWVMGVVETGAMRPFDMEELVPVPKPVVWLTSIAVETDVLQ